MGGKIEAEQTGGVGDKGNKGDDDDKEKEGKKA